MNTQSHRERVSTLPPSKQERSHIAKREMEPLKKRKVKMKKVKK